MLDLFFKYVLNVFIKKSPFNVLLTLRKMKNPKGTKKF
ncbi:hypothetical protein CJD_1878 [Clostridium perfringens D str. JGS1721]|uniref:Uncharacterized protein n=1 Tax=Clostridium perfringens D str. JGS1721 TaxID=488537 RepID=B1V1I0_CLOPF|nr:hypothetical protein CJD_1878 [Clostridium perfringens D str. JGS1721]